MNSNEYKEKILEFMEQKKLSFDNLRKGLGVKGEQDMTSFSCALEELRAEGKLYLDNNFYKLFTKDLGLYQSKIKIINNGKGVTKINGKKFYIPKEKLNGALDKDIVVLKPFCFNDNRVGAEVVQIVKRYNNTLVCELTEDRQLVPLKSKYNIKLVFNDDYTLVPGDRVLVRLGKENNSGFEVEIQNVIGNVNDLNIELTTIAYEFGFDNTTTEQVQKQLREIPTQVEDESIKDRKDLTDEMIYTIDGVCTKDIDDAISIDINEKGNYVLKVHIADVSHYIKEGTPLYNQAKERATSLYLIDKVIPMFPHQISNGICSLNENERRLAITCEMEIDKEGQVTSFDIYESVISSNKKMNYDDVNSIVEKGKWVKGYGKYVDNLCLFKEFSEIATKARINRGSLFFESTEHNILMNGDKPVSFAVKRKGLGEGMIENAMLYANETVAAMIYYMQLPFIYRNHGRPDEDKIKKGLEELKHVSIFKNYSNLMYFKNLSKLLKKVGKTKEFELMSPYILRLLPRALYEAECDEHYGLGLRQYTHFTSPIRRFPDLIVHSLLRRYLFQYNFDDLDEISKELVEIASHSSYKERQADAAEAAAEQMEMAKYMEEHFEELKEQNIAAKITWLDDKGAIVTLNNGIIGSLEYDRFSASSKLSYNRKDHSLNGKYHGKKVKYSIGDEVVVRLKQASAKDRYILFTLVSPLIKTNDLLTIFEPFKKHREKKLIR